VLSGSGYGFNGPTRVADDGTHVWVANSGEDLTGGDSVTELNASDGSLVRVLQGGSFGFNVPYGIAVYGAHVWVTNVDGDSVTELNASDGSLVRVLFGGNYGFDQPSDISAGDGRVWVGNQNSVTVLNASDGSLVRVLPGGSSGIAIEGAHAWLTGIPNINSVTELNAADGSLVRVLAGGDYGFKDTYAVAVDGPHIWIVNDPDALGDGGGDSVTELNAGDGSLVRVLAGGSHDIKGTIDIAADGKNVWIANSAAIVGNRSGNWVTELNSHDGSLTRVLNGGSYGINDPIDIAADGNHVFVTSLNTSVTELTTG
jgi:hypothetical protein